jgi:flagellar biogenesis protein FliO
VPGIQYYGLQITTPLDNTVLRVIALVAVLAFVVRRLRQNRRASRDQVGAAV